MSAAEIALREIGSHAEDEEVVAIEVDIHGQDTARRRLEKPCYTPEVLAIARSGA